MSDGDASDDDGDAGDDDGDAGDDDGDAGDDAVSGGATRVAIACQGGGSHTAFTAGVLRTLLADWENGCELVGISGTSGGSFNALAVWYGLMTGGADLARDLLDGIWNDLAARDAGDRWLNEWLTGLSRMESAGLAIPQVSPYQMPGPERGKERIREALENHIDFDDIPRLCSDTHPQLVVGTVDVNAGVFETFTNEDVTVEAVLASTAVPNVFQAVELHGHYHWDGLFSQNPPVRDLMHVPPGRKPEELWVIQINPQEFEGEPKTMDVIADRRNELSGNISLNQELRFVEQVNEWVEDGTLPADEFVTTDVHRIEMGEQFHCSTKLDRDPDFLAELRDLGNRRAREFLDRRSGDASG